MCRQYVVDFMIELRHHGPQCVAREFTLMNRLYQVKKEMKMTCAGQAGFAQFFQPVDHILTHRFQHAVARLTVAVAFNLDEGFVNQPTE